LIERETEKFTPFSDYPTFFGDYNGDGIEKTRNRLAFAGEWRGVFADRLALSAGVRRDGRGGGRRRGRRLPSKRRRRCQR